MKSVLLGAAALAALTTAASARTINWTDWVSESTAGGGVTVTGTIDVGGTSVGVTYRNQAGIAFLNDGVGAETDYWTAGGVRNPATSPYTSVGSEGVDNIPTGTDMVALRFAGEQTLTFSKPVSDVYFAFVSLNGNGYAFDRDFDLLSSGSQNLDGNGTDACGYWGCGTAAKSVVGDEFQLIGTGEPHGTLLLDGTFTTLSWRSLTSEFWNGFTVGVAGLGDEPGEGPDPIPVPAAGWLLVSALGAAGLWGRRRKA